MTTEQTNDNSANDPRPLESRFEAITPPRHHDEVPLPPPVAPLRANTLGLVAFILSLVGFCVPFVASLAALICGIIAVRRQPRGFAIAAIVISCLSGCVSGFTLAALLPALAIGKNAAKVAKTTISGSEVLMRVSEFKVDQSTLPKDLVECYGDEIPPFDAWGTPLKLVIETEGTTTNIFVWSAGKDAVWDSEDDWVVACEPPTAAADKAYNESGMK